MKEKKFSRIPVWESDEENIIGILYAKDLLNIKDMNKKLRYYRNILRKPFFVPDSISADILLRNFKSTSNHLAIVIDEYGGTSGLVTFEDILEEIIGEVVDKDDIKPLYYKYDSNIIEVAAKMEINEFNSVFKTNLKSEDAVSIGGYVLECIKRIPQPGETVIINNLKFKITGTKPNKIEEMLVTKMKKIYPMKKSKKELKS